MDNGEFDDVDDNDPTLVEDPGPALEKALDRAGRLIASMQTTLPLLRKADPDAQRFLAKAIGRDFLRVCGDFELIAPLILKVYG